MRDPAGLAHFVLKLGLLRLLLGLVEFGNLVLAIRLITEAFLLRGFASLELNSHLSILSYHLTPGVLDAAERIGNVMGLMLDDEALVHRGVVLVVVNEVLLNLEKNFILTPSAHLAIFDSAAFTIHHLNSAYLLLLLLPT